MPDTRTAYRSSTRGSRASNTQPESPSVSYPAPPQRSSGSRGGGVVGDASGGAFYNPQSATSVSGGAAFDSTGKPLINPLTGQAVQAGSGAGARAQFNRVYKIGRAHV